MAFTTDDLHDFLTLLETHPEWRMELRRFVLTDDLLSLPEQLTLLRARSEEQFQALIAAQQRTDTRLTALTAQVTALAEAQQHTEARLTALVEAQQRTETRLTTLVEAQQRTEARLTALAEAQQHTEARLTALVEAQQRTETRLATIIDDVGELKGDNLEVRYRTRSQQYFRRLMRRPHVLTADEFTTLLDDALDRGSLSEAEADDLAALDIIVQGRHHTERTEMYLAVEVSWGVGTRDVERAVRRAAYLSRIGLTTVPVVAGKWITPEALQLAQHAQVQHLTERRFTPLDDPNTPETNPGVSGSES